MNAVSGTGSVKPAVTKLISSAGLAALCVINLVPILLVLRQALSPESESSAWPLTILPQHISLTSLVSLWQTQSLLRHAFLSLWVALGTTFVALVLGFPAGWAAARWRRMSALMTRTSLLSRVMPPIAIAIPLTALLIPLGLYNHPLGLGLIIAHLTLGLPFVILISYASLVDMPPQLEEAAQVDGCSILGAFWRVTVPAARGAIGAAFLLSFLLSWDEFTYALLIQLTHRTMPPLIYYFAEFGQMGAASTLAALMLIPAVAIIGSLQHLKTRGLLSGGLKG
jgi:ABC-type glycerol-3-phosphate transport system permease component